MIFCCFLPVAAQAAEQDIDVAGLKVAAWLPDQMQGAPVIIFSHGFHGCKTQSKFLMEALAEAGYAVFAPNHKDAACANLLKWFSRPAENFSHPGDWSADTYRDRYDDIEKLLDALEKDPGYYMLDWKHVGMSGHSLGGYTALALAGAWPSWKDSRIKAVLALSPYSTPFIRGHTLGGIDVPVMYQGGTLDKDITPHIVKKGGAYDSTPAPKYFMELDGAGHFAWTDLRSAYHDTINRYSIAFFDRYLKGKTFPAELDQKPDDVVDLRIEK